MNIDTVHYLVAHRETGILWNILLYGVKCNALIISVSTSCCSLAPIVQFTETSLFLLIMIISFQLPSSYKADLIWVWLARHNQHLQLQILTRCFYYTNGRFNRWYNWCNCLKPSNKRRPHLPKELYILASSIFWVKINDLHLL